MPRSSESEKPEPRRKMIHDISHSGTSKVDEFLIYDSFRKHMTFDPFSEKRHNMISLAGNVPITASLCYYFGNKIIAEVIRNSMPPCSPLRKR